MMQSQPMRDYGTPMRGRRAVTTGSLQSRVRPQMERSRGTTNGQGEVLAKGLGGFSLGLGLALLGAPRAMARLIGVPPDRDNLDVLCAVGLRELTSGIGILAKPNPAGWLRARVGGDMMDLALLGSAFTSERTSKGRVAMATAAVAGVTMLDVLAHQQQTGQAGSVGATMRSALAQVPSPARLLPRSTVHVKKAITVNRSPEELYRFWHDFENLPRFMSHLEAVQVTGPQRSRWKAKAPAHMSVEWEAITTADTPNALIAWRSIEGSDIENAGSVRFVPAPGGRGTEVHVELYYKPPAGQVGRMIAMLFGEAPEQQLEDDLRAFKQVMETGEIVRSDASIHRGPHPARPSGGYRR